MDWFSAPPTGVFRLLLAVWLALFAAAAIRLWLLREADRELWRKRTGSLKTWWVLATLLTAASLLGRFGAVALLATASWLALGEYVRLIRPPKVDRPAVFWAFAAVAVNYLLILFSARTAFVAFVPLGVLALLGSRLVLAGETEHFVRRVGGLYFGVMVLVYGLSHGAALFFLPLETNLPAGHVGWFLYLIVLTEMNDISQALVGRQFGRHKITPRVSPHKTWEGFLGGVAVTVLLAVALAPVLTSPGQHSAAAGTLREASLSGVWAVLAGLLISIGGFLGDVNMSAVKRDAGVKDSGTLLPGQGGVIDRVDGLTFSAPLFFYYVSWLYQ